MKTWEYMVVALLCLVSAACQDKEIEMAAPVIEPIDASLISGQLVGNDYVWTWTAPQPDLKMHVSVYQGTTIHSTETVGGNTYTHRNVDTNIEYTYVFKQTDGTNISFGVTKSYLREGASPVSGVAMSQVDKEGGYDALVTWTADLDPYRVLFWIRDVEDGRNGDDLFDMPAVVDAATPYVSEWYKNGGSLLLWSRATPYITALGRLDKKLLLSNDRNIGTGHGNNNPDVWKMAVELHPGSRFKKDASSHPMFKGLDYETTDRTKLIAVEGPGWAEDHNCLYFNIPSVLTDLGNQEESCYNTIVNEYGIIPLATWDSQIDWVSQLNIWEAQQGNTEFKGTIICMGNGGCEFSMRNADGSADVSAYPSNNIYEDNILKMAKNALEYLKTR